MKQRNILLQIIELIMIPFDLLGAIIKGFREGGLKYGRGNFTVACRHRHGAIYVYRPSLRNYILHVIGVFFMDPFGRYFISAYGPDGYERKRKRPFKVYASEKQWLDHPVPRVRKMAKEYVAWAGEKETA